MVFHLGLWGVLGFDAATPCIAEGSHDTRDHSHASVPTLPGPIKAQRLPVRVGFHPPTLTSMGVEESAR